MGLIISKLTNCNIEVLHVPCTCKATAGIPLAFDMVGFTPFFRARRSLG